MRASSLSILSNHFITDINHNTTAELHRIHVVVMSMGKIRSSFKYFDLCISVM